MMAQPPTPTAAQIALDDGTLVNVRPISPSDAAQLTQFHRGLSDRSRYLRYFYPHSELSPDEVAHLTEVDGCARVALVAELDDQLIAVGRYDRLDDPARAEVAFVVADQFQHHGIATELLRRLAAAATTVGISHFTAEVLDENKAMLSVFHDAGFPFSTPRTSGAPSSSR